VKADLVEVSSALEAFVALRFEDEKRYPLGAGLAGSRDHDDEIGELAIGDEGLLPVDHIGVALPPRRGAHALQVGAGARLGHGDGADELALRHPREPAPLLLLGAIVQDVMGDDGAVHRDADRHLGHDRLEILDHRRLIGEARADAAIGFRHARQKRAHLAERAPRRAIDLLLLSPRLGLRGELLRQKIAKRIAELVELRCHPGRTIGHRNPHAPERARKPRASCAYGGAAMLTSAGKRGGWRA
jgi:hypothetical protein